MAAIQLLKNLFRPRGARSDLEHALQRHIRERRILRIVEIGLGDASRATSMITAAQRQARGDSVDFTGIDMFDARGAHESRLSLKAVHRQLAATGAAVRLIPGDPYTALSQFANRLSARELIVVSAGQDAEALEKSWFYMPRMLGQGATVWLESRQPAQGDSPFQVLSFSDVSARAQSPKRRAA